MPANWTAPRTWANNELVDANLMNTHLRDNLEWLKSPTWEQVIGSGAGNFAVSPTINTWTKLSTSPTYEFEKQLTTKGGRILACFAAMVNTTSTGTTSFSVEVDGTVQGSGVANHEGLAAMFGAGNAYLNFIFPLALTAGLHTFRIMTRLTVAGTITVYNHPSSGGQRLAPIFWVGEIA